MNIDSIQNGIVLDHITAGKAMLVYKYLGLISWTVLWQLLRMQSATRWAERIF